MIGLLQPALSLFVMIPLYFYPDDGATAWNPVFSAISSHPKVQFQVIINPDSGPGSGQYPDVNFITGVSKLNSYKNVKLVGYVVLSWEEALR